MAEFTKEQLIAQAQENVKALKMAAVQNAFKEIRPAIELDLRLAEIALATLTAGVGQDPVYQVLSGDAWVDLSKGAMESQARVGATVRTLYAAPQLPQPAVPDENGLLPCPFCGGGPEEDAGGCSEYDGHEHQDYSINCKSCGAEVYCAVGSFEKADVPCSCHHNTREICVDKWNRRAAMLQGAEPTKQEGK